MSLATSLDHLVRVGEAVWRASWHGSVVAAIVLAALLVCGRRIAPRWRHAMWMIVLLRLALPVTPSSPISVFNLARTDLAPTTKGPEKLVVFTHPNAFGRSNVVENVGISSSESGGQRRTPTATSTERTAVMPERASVARQMQTAAELAEERKSVPAVAVTWKHVVAALWAAGVLLLASRIAWATLRVSRTMRRLKPVNDANVLAVLRSAGAELRVRRLPLLLTGDDTFNPALVGFLRPRILLPRDLIDRFDRGELRLVLLHELAHLKRRDVLVNWLATLLSVLHWPNPVVWLVAWRLRLERELACDELVISAAGSDADRRAYRHTIVKLLETLSPRARSVPAYSVGILEGSQQMKRRIAMIARFVERPRGWGALAVVLIVGVALVALTDAVRAQAPVAPAPPAAAAKPSTKPVTIEVDELVTVSIYGLMSSDTETFKTARVDQEGNVTLPLVGAVKAAGLRPLELEKAVAKVYSERGLLKDPIVVVSLPRLGESHQLVAKPGGGAGREAQPQTQLVMRAYEVSDLIPADDPKTGAADLAKVIAQTVEPDSWREAGGRHAIGAFGTKVVITATPDVHQAVDNLLAILAESDSVRTEDMTEQQMAAVDMQLANHLKLREDVRSQIELERQKGAEQSGKRLAQLQEALKVREKLIGERVEWFRAKHKGRQWRPAQIGVNAAAGAAPAGAIPAHARIVRGANAWNAERLEWEPPANARFARAQKLWDEKYKQRVYKIGNTSNYDKVAEEFLAEVQGWSATDKGGEEKP